MRFDTDLPKKYDELIWSMPAFSKSGKITRRARNGLENTMFLYSHLALSIAKATEDNPGNFRVKEVSIVGSAARENRVKSDLDFLLIVPDISEQAAKDLKTTISYVLFCDRPKTEAVDVFVRARDAYPGRDSVDITDQAQVIIDKYNAILEKASK